MSKIRITERDIKKALKKVKHPILPYPKTSDMIESEVIKVKVHNFGKIKGEQQWNGQQQLGYGQV